MFTGLFDRIWDTIHIIARALPHGELAPSQRDRFVEMLKGLLPLVPCPSCALHGVSYFMNHIPSPKTGQEAWEWTVEFHNEVNRQTKKRLYTPEEAEKALIARLERDLKDMPRAQQIQLEDAKKITALQEEVKLFKNIPHAITNEGLFIYVLIAMIVAIITLLFVIILFVVLVKTTNKIKAITSTLTAGTSLVI